MVRVNTAPLMSEDEAIRRAIEWLHGEVDAVEVELVYDRYWLVALKGHFQRQGSRPRHPFARPGPDPEMSVSIAAFDGANPRRDMLVSIFQRP